jgi:nitrite reductase/ring-hydroxylating ferredoxin subunit
MAAHTSLPPYPAGWYVAGFSDELPPGGLFARPFMGQEVVVFRTRSGQACAADAYCPHLGAHFGHGGRMEGDLLRCPFHGFCFDTMGTCVKTGYGTTPPPTARLKLWPLREVNGMLLVYHDARGAPPTWEVPALDTVDWTPLIYQSFTLADHPQETTENSVDIGHFAFVHRYRDVRELRELVSAGPYLSTAYAVKRPLLGRLTPEIFMDVSFETEIYGFGYSLVNVTVPLLDLRARFWVLSTAIDTERLILRLAVSMAVIERKRLPVPLRVLPLKPLSRVVARALMWGFVADARQDFVIWQHKRYVQPPALAKGDGPIGKYRIWARQFYREQDQG